MKQLKKDIILANVPKNRINIDIFEEIDSTNEFLKKNIQSNEFNLVASEKQTNGKGRRGNKWHSPKKGNIYMSISTKNTFKSGPLSLITGIICTKVLSNVSQTEEIGLKWPNDLVFNNKKIGGILVEKDIYANEEKTIIGIGINFNINGEENWWGDISELKIEDQRNLIIAKITSEIIKVYDENHFDWVNQWENLCIHLNKEVKINNHDSTTEDGVFIGIEDDGSALIKTESGMKSFKSSEISIKGVY